jgi:hypothetical protein
MGEHHRQRPLRGVAGPAGRGGEVDVHVDQARHQSHSARLDPARPRRNPNLRPGSHGEDPVARNQNRLIGKPLGPGHRQDVRADDGDDRLRGRSGRGQGEESRRERGDQA